MRSLLPLCLLAAFAGAQATTATERLSHFVHGGTALPWHELGEVLVKATMDEDAVVVSRELIDNLDASRPTENRERALTALLRWSELPTFGARTAADSKRLGTTLLAVVEQHDLEVTLRGRALVALAQLPRERSSQIARIEAALRRRLNARAKVDAEAQAMAPFQLRFLAAAAPDSLWTLPLVAEITVTEITRGAESGGDIWKAGVQALAAIGRRGATTDARTAFVACAKLLPGGNKPEFLAITKTMADLLSARSDLLAAEAPLQAAAIMLERVQAIADDNTVETATGLGKLANLGIGQQVRSIGLAAFAALATLQPEAVRQQLQTRFDKILRAADDSDPDLRALQRAWAERKH